MVLGVGFVLSVVRLSSRPMDIGPGVETVSSRKKKVTSQVMREKLAGIAQGRKIRICFKKIHFAEQIWKSFGRSCTGKHPDDVEGCHVARTTCLSRCQIVPLHTWER